jgi:hypothetical protein
MGQSQSLAADFTILKNDHELKIGRRDTDQATSAKPL